MHCIYTPQNTIFKYRKIFALFLPLTDFQGRTSLHEKRLYLNA